MLRGGRRPRPISCGPGSQPAPSHAAIRALRRGGHTQTFLPYPDFFKSLDALDNRRLGKQRVEALQVLRALEREHYGWKHHPCVKMWAGHCDALKAYYNIAVALWVARGFRNTMPFLYPSDPVPPPWLGDQRLHSSHRANLLRKEPEYYGRFGWREEPANHYWWPV